ncbi:hypothetical protein BRAS3843_2790018 [Bradyrhizobium sp. STM 3843]|nr:hypothetical protein BRAS3843_2790018 [Bradyrhizobium sp. STM 3843]
MGVSMLQRDLIMPTNNTMRTAKSCGPGAPVLALRFAVLDEPVADGGKKADPRGDRV